MAEYAVNLNNGKTDEKGQFRLLGKLLNQSGVIEATGLTVAATTPTPDMTVKVSGSAANDNAVFITSTGDTYHGWNTAQYSVTILSNATGVTKYDAIVAYIDTAAGSTTANNPGGLKLVAVRGSSTDGVTKATSADIAASVVGTKPSIRLADVTVSNGVSSINSGNVVDTRPIARIGNGLVTSAALKPTAGLLRASTYLSLTTAATLVPGQTFSVTPTVASLLRVTTVFDFDGYGAASAGDYAIGSLFVNGSVQSGSAIYIFPSSTGRATVAQLYELSLTANTSYTVEQRAANTIAARGRCNDIHTVLSWDMRAA